MRRTALLLTVCALVLLGMKAYGTPGPERAAASPIEHVVILYQENHSFNDLLGRLCVDEGNRCEGTTVGEISTGRRIELAPESDIPPAAGHLPADQLAAINRGKMNGWDRVDKCGPKNGYGCLTQAHAGRVPTLWTLADTYALSDRTFETSISASWGSHLELVAGTMDGFIGDEPETAIGIGDGGGCDSNKDTSWQGPGYHQPIQVPSCVPDAQGRGPYRTSPVEYVPTIMDTLDAGGLPWHIYAPGKHGGGGYGWAICPTFYECLSTDQDARMRQPGDFAKAAEAGKLPALSIVVPYPNQSQHNGHSLMAGDNWIAKNVNAVMNGPDWSSTAIFITYDDCGCYYDPVRPPKGYGIRVPMVIVSPYVKERFVDHTTTSLASMLAFVEHTFGLDPLPGGEDGIAYDYSDAFDFAQAPRPPIQLRQHAVPNASLDHMASHPPDPNDPT